MTLELPVIPICQSTSITRISDNTVDISIFLSQNLMKGFCFVVVYNYLSTWSFHWILLLFCSSNNQQKTMCADIGMTYMLHLSQHTVVEVMSITVSHLLYKPNLHRAPVNWLSGCASYSATVWHLTNDVLWWAFLCASSPLSWPSVERQLSVVWCGVGLWCVAITNGVMGKAPSRVLFIDQIPIAKAASEVKCW